MLNLAISVILYFWYSSGNYFEFPLNNIMNCLGFLSEVPYTLSACLFISDITWNRIEGFILGLVFKSLNSLALIPLLDGLDKIHHCRRYAKARYYANSLSDVAPLRLYLEISVETRTIAIPLTCALNIQLMTFWILVFNLLHLLQFVNYLCHFLCPFLAY